MAISVSESEINFNILTGLLTEENHHIDTVYEILTKVEKFDKLLEDTNTNEIIEFFERYVYTIKYLTPYAYKHANRLKHYENIICLIHKYNSIECLVNDDLFISILTGITKCMYGQKILYKIDEKYFNDTIKTCFRRLAYIGAMEGTLPTFIFWFKKIYETHITSDFIYDIIISSFGNTDDRVYKYLIEKKIINNTTINMIGLEIIKKIMVDKIPIKYQLRRIKNLSAFTNLNNYISTLIKGCGDFNSLKTILKYYYTQPINYYTNMTDLQHSDNLQHLPHFTMAILCFNADESICYSNIKYIYNILENISEKTLFVICVFIYYKSIFNLNIKYINDNSNEYYYILRGLLNSINILKIINESNDGSFHKIIQVFKPEVIEEYIYNYLEDISKNNVLFILFPYVRYFRPILDTANIKLNKCLYYLRIYIRKKNRLRKLYNHVRLLPVINELKSLQPGNTKPVFKRITNGYNTRKQKFNYVPPYHLLPGQLQNLDFNFYIKEKADGILVKTIPTKIQPIHNFIEKLKAEYIEDLDLYLVFDLDIDISIEDRYKYLRKSHPSTKSLPLQSELNCYTKSQLIESILEERKVFSKFLALPYENYRWYPKAAWRISNPDKLFLETLCDFVNPKCNNNNVFIKWLCDEGPVKNDGLIITPLNGNREIKLKPKYLMTIDLLYKNGNWGDRNSTCQYNDIVKNIDNLELEENTIWRCYPQDNVFVPKEIRFDKNYPNPRTVVNNIINLYKIKYNSNPDYPYNRLYFTNKQFIFNKKWKDIIDINNTIIEKHIRNYSNSLSWLDLGCGKGKLLKFISGSNLDYNYYGIDYDVNVLVKANQLHNSKKNIFNYLNLATNWNNTKDKWMTFDFDKRFDVVVAINSIMHFFTDKFWEQLNQIVKKDTKFIFNVVNEKVKDNFILDCNDNSYIKYEDNMVKYRFSSVHVSEMTEVFITKDSIHEMVTKYNWKIINTYTHETGLPSLYTWYTLISL